MSLIDPLGETLSQRELRNDSGRVLRAVASGRSFIIANGGTPIGKLVPLDAPRDGLSIVRPAKRVGGWRRLAARRVAGVTPLAESLDDLRGDRL